MHERTGGEIGFGGEAGNVKRGETAPEVERVGEPFEPDFVG